LRVPTLPGNSAGNTADGKWWAVKDSNLGPRD
jgi:hypothetical protein